MTKPIFTIISKRVKKVLFWMLVKEANHLRCAKGESRSSDAISEDKSFS